jgi:hypothetical protein
VFREGRGAEKQNQKGSAMTQTTTRKSWKEMTNDEKLDRLTTVLTRAGSDNEFRNRCLESTESAMKAVSEAGDIEFPPDFEIQFLTPEQRLKTLVIAMPDFIAPGKAEAEVRNAEDYQSCTYRLWRS